MTKAIQAIFVLAITVAFSGCLITTRPNRGHSHHKSKRGCHPSQYWNGNRCVHKSKRNKHKKPKKHDHRKHKKDKHDHRR